MNMSERIKERRRALNLTQEELGAKLGLQKSAIAKYENGRVQNIKRSTILKMSEILECSPSYLMGLEDETDINEKESTSGKKYYFDDATAAKAQELFENSDMRILFDAASGSTPEDLQMAADLLKRLKGSNDAG